MLSNYAKRDTLEGGNRMKKDTLKLGVVSAIGRGAFLAAIYSKHPRIELVAVCDQDKKAFEQRRKEFKVEKGAYREYLSLDDMLDGEDMDWVIVATGDTTHHKLGKKVLEAGCNLYVEKPMCVTIEEADDLWRTERRTGKSVVVGCELRYHAAVRKFREILRRGDIGKIVMGYAISTQKRGNTYFRRKYRNRSYGSSPLMQKGIHLMDLVNDFAGSDPVSVYAGGGRALFGGRDDCRGRVCTRCPEANTCDYHFRNGAVAGNRDLKAKDALPTQIACVFDAGIDVNDNTMMLVEFANGIRMSVAEIFFAPDNAWRFMLQGTRGHAHLVIGVENYIEIFRSSEKKPEKTKVRATGAGHVGDMDMRDALVKAHFSGERIYPTARDGRAGVAVLAKAMESEEKGKVMRIPWPDKKY